jgi:alpha-amylase
MVGSVNLAAAHAEVVLHAFDWHYREVAEKATSIADAGYSAVLVMPPHKSKVDADGESAWWQHYQPQDLRVVEHSRGNKEDLVAMISALHRAGVEVYADVVLNHMANDPELHPGLAYPGQSVLGAYAAHPTYYAAQRLFGNIEYNYLSGFDFHWPSCISDYRDRDQLIRGRICGAYPDPGLPDLRDSDGSGSAAWVNSVRRDYINALVSLGIDGFRVDAAKHMPTGALTSVFSDALNQAKPARIFAEIITWGGPNDGAAGQNSEHFLLSDYVSATPPSFGAYDFPLLNRIRDAFGFRESLGALAYPEAIGDALPSERALTVVVTHDIPYNGIFRGLILDPRDEELAYAYVLGRGRGTPMVFDDGTPEPTDGGRWADAWRSPRLLPMIAFHNAVEGEGYEVLLANHCVLLFRRGSAGVVGINKCGETQNVTVETWWRFDRTRPYVDQLSGESLRISGDRQSFSLPPRQAKLWLRQG